MKQALLLPLILLFSMLATSSFAAPHAPKPADKESVEKTAVSAEKDWENLSKKEQRTKKKALRKELKSTLKAAKKQAASDVDLTLLVILAIFIPPLAMGIYEGITKRFWISLLLTLLLFLPGMIYTLVVILKDR